MFNRMNQILAEESLSANHSDGGVEMKGFRAATKDVLVAELWGMLSSFRDCPGGYPLLLCWGGNFLHPTPIKF